MSALCVYRGVVYILRFRIEPNTHGGFNEVESLRLQLLDMMMSGILAQSLAVAAELGIADLLADGPKSVAELAANTRVQSGKLHRLLRYIASHGVFRESADGRFELTPLAEVLRSDSPHSVR